MINNEQSYTIFSYPLVNNHNEQDQVPFSQCIVPNKTSVNPETQAIYANSCWEGCQKIVLLLEHNPSFDSILELTGKLRQEIELASCQATLPTNRMKVDGLNDFFNDGFGDIEVELYTVQERRFGALRTNQKIETPLCNDYQDMYQAIKELDQNEPMMRWEFCSNDEHHCTKIGYRLGIDFNQQVIHLSKYMCYIWQEKSVILHTLPENLPAAKNQCRYLYNEILRLDVQAHPEFIHYLIGKLHWWLVQGAFFKRSSASCAEILIAALTIKKFGRITPYKEGVFPDKIALVTSCETFEAIYQTFRL